MPIHQNSAFDYGLRQIQFSDVKVNTNRIFPSNILNLGPNESYLSFVSSSIYRDIDAGVVNIIDCNQKALLLRSIAIDSITHNCCAITSMRATVKYIHQIVVHVETCAGDVQWELEGIQW